MNRVIEILFQNSAAADLNDIKDKFKRIANEKSKDLNLQTGVYVGNIPLD